VSEAGENAKFLMTIESLVTGFRPAGDPVAVALADEGVVALADEEVLELLEQAVSATTRMSPVTPSQLR
jgi:hypothetical protein